MNTIKANALSIALCAGFACGSAAAQNDADLAQQLSNPIASLISVPFQLNWDQNIGPDDDGQRVTLNVQPVAPFEISENWNVISRTIVPLVSQDDIFPSAGSQFGLGDTVQSLFFSPKAPTASGWIWGVGPVFLLPTATDDLLGADEFGLGPTGVALKQSGPWTYGALVNHIASFDSNNKINATFLQPFMAYNTPTAWTYTLQAETTYDWEAEQWSAPVGAIVSKLTKIGNSPVSFSGGLRYWADAPAGGPDGLSVRVVMTLLFPK